MSDLFDFFKDNESKLHEAPSAQAWNKLEAKLEKRKRRKRRNIQFLQLGYVIVAVLFLLMIAYLVWSRFNAAAK
ncbi:MAG: hypothetical protein RIR11_1980 [Bacteroidota bacterium]|jgi:hypothetical protein